MLNIIRITSFTHSERAVNLEKVQICTYLCKYEGKVLLISAFTKDRLKMPSTPNSK